MNDEYIVEELSIEVTNECNLSCIHCSSGSRPKKLQGEMTVDVQLRLVEEARELGATVLSLSGGNPLLYEFLPWLVDEADGQGYERVLIYTTGHSRHSNYIWDYEHVGEMMEHESVVWIFSLHSHLSEMNDWIMNKPNALENIKAGIAWLKDLGQEVELHMVPMKPNFRHIPGVAKLAEEMGIDKLSFLRFVPQTRGYTNRDKLNMTVDEFVEMQHLLHQVVNGGFVTRLGCPIDFRHAVGLTKKKAKPCHAGDDLILVRPTGDVHPCAAWKSLPSDTNVMDYSLRDIWEESEVFNAIRAFKMTGYISIDGCIRCPYLESCMSGCPAQRLHAYGKTIGDLYDMRSDPLCPIGSEATSK